MIVTFIIGFIIAVLFFCFSYKALNDNAANIAYNKKSILLTCLLIGCFWPLFIIVAVVLWISKRSKGRKILKDIDDKISSAFDNL